VPQAPEVDRVQREIGRRVRAARLRAGMTQEAAAGEAGIDYKRWQRIETGEVNCTIRSLVRIAAALDTTFWRLLSARR